MPPPQPFFFIFTQLVEYLKMKPDGLVTVLGESCVNGRPSDRTEPFSLNIITLNFHSHTVLPTFNSNLFTQHFRYAQCSCYGKC